MPYPSYRPCPYSYDAVQHVCTELLHRNRNVGANLLTGDAAVLLDALTERFGYNPDVPSVSEMYSCCPPESRPTYWMAAAYLQVWVDTDHSRMMRNGQDAYAYSRTIMEGVALYLDGNQHAISTILNRFQAQHLQSVPGYVQALTWILCQRSGNMYYPDMLAQWQMYHLIDKITPE